jgi:hypothetical protein
MNYFKQLVIKGNLNASEVLSDLSNWDAVEKENSNKKEQLKTNC